MSNVAYSSKEVRVSHVEIVTLDSQREVSHAVMHT